MADVIVYGECLTGPCDRCGCLLCAVVQRVTGSNCRHGGLSLPSPRSRKLASSKGK